MFSELKIYEGDDRSSTCTFEEFIKIVKELHNKEWEIVIGTDSKVKKKNVFFATCVVAHHPSHGGKIWWVTDKLKRREFPGMQKRLMYETMKSIWAAIEIEETLGFRPEIHIDINMDEESGLSGKYINEFKGMVVGNGYNCTEKPDSWAACSVADKLVKKLAKKR